MLPLRKIKVWPVEASRNLEISLTERNIETNISSVKIRWASIYDIKCCQCKCRYKRTISVGDTINCHKTHSSYSRSVMAKK